MILPAHSEGLYLLQRVRDEAHRFAITYHRHKRAKAMTAQRTGRRARPRASPAQGTDQALRLGEAAQRGRRSTRSPRCPASAATAEAVVAGLAGRARARAVNAATGEIIDAHGPHDRRRDGPAGRQRSTAGSDATTVAEQPAAQVARAGDHHRHVRGRPQHRGQVPGGPRLVRRRQPAARPAPHHGRPRRPHPGHRRPDRRRRRRPRPRVLRPPASAPSTTSTQAARPPRVRLPRGRRRRPRAPLRVRTAGRTRCRATAGSSTASPPSASCSRELRGDADLVIDTTSAQRARAARQDRARRSPATESRSCGPPSCRSASSTACRSTPTWWWTAGSCPTRTGSPSCAPLPVTTPDGRDYVLNQPGAEEFLDRYTELLDLIAAGYRARASAS